MSATPAPIEHLLRAATAALDSSPSPRLDAEVLLANCLSRARSYLYAHPEERPEDPQCANYDALIRRRARGEPVAYITGRREFWSLSLEVNSTTLIPRPETELLVTAALGMLFRKTPAAVADLGTGSGAVALAIAVERPCAELWASDISEAAIAVARRNRDRLGVDNLRLLSGSWYDAFPNGQRFEVIVSNPPYVRSADRHLQEGDLRFEPRSALVAGPDGLDAIRILTAGARRRLKPGGALIIEHGADQADEVLSLMTSAALRRARNLRDAAGLPRVSLAHA